MFKKLKQSKGQGIAVQYALLFFMVVAVIVNMTTYIKRAMQARIYGARQYMLDQVNAVHSDPSGNYVGTVQPEYEPYYAISRADSTQRLRQTRETSGLGNTSIFTLGINEFRGARSTGNQLPPAQAK